MRNLACEHHEIVDPKLATQLGKRSFLWPSADDDQSYSLVGVLGQPDGANEHVVTLAHDQAPHRQGVGPWEIGLRARPPPGVGDIADWVPVKNRSARCVKAWIGSCDRVKNVGRNRGDEVDTGDHEPEKAAIEPRTPPESIDIAPVKRDYEAPRAEDVQETKVERRRHRAMQMDNFDALPPEERPQIMKR